MFFGVGILGFCRGFNWLWIMCLRFWRESFVVMFLVVVV